MPLLMPQHMPHHVVLSETYVFSAKSQLMILGGSNPVNTALCLD